MKQYPFGFKWLKSRQNLIAVVLILVGVNLSCSSSSSSFEGESNDTDLNLGVVFYEFTDNRRIPLACTSGQDCDDADACTLDYCVNGLCEFAPIILPMTVSMPIMPTKISHATIHGNRLYTVSIGDSKVVTQYRIGDLNLLEQVAVANINTAVLGIDAAGDGVFLAEGEAGLVGFIRDSMESPAISVTPGEGVLSQIDNVVDIELSYSNGFISGFDEGVTVIEGDFVSPSRIGTVNTIGRAVAVASRGSFALVADSLGGAATIRIQDGVPVVGGVVPTEGRVVDSAIRRNSGLIAEFGAGASLLDLSNSTEPKRLLTISTETPVVSVRLLGAQTGLILTEDGKLQRVSFAPFLEPSILETVDLGRTPKIRAMDLYNNNGVVVFEDGQLAIFNANCAF